MASVTKVSGSRRGRALRHVALFGAAGVVAVGIVVAAFLGAVAPPRSSPRIAAAATAKMLCTGIFVSGLDEARIRHQDLAGMPELPARVDRVHQRVLVRDASAQADAEYRKGLGCTLRQGGAASADPVRLAPATTEKQWRAVELPRTPRADLAPVLAHAFAEEDPTHVKNTRAVLIIQHGRIVAERYAPGISARTRLPGYSMTKGVTDLLVGTAVRRGWMSLDQADLRPEWRAKKDDPRRKITLAQLLRMTSGLAWNEGYLGTDSDLMTMLTSVDDPAAFAASRPMARAATGKPFAPGQHWTYSGGSYELVSSALANAVRVHGGNPAAYPYEALFRPAGMTSVVLEPAPDGVFMLSSFMLATAPDWGRLGLFLLDADVDGPLSAQVLPHGWVRDSIRPTVASGFVGGRRMGAGIWSGSLGKDVPQGTFYLAGFEGQFVIVVPRMDLVVVRLGASPVDGNWAARQLMEDLIPRLQSTSGDPPSIRTAETTSSPPTSIDLFPPTSTSSRSESHDRNRPEIAAR